MIYLMGAQKAEFFRAIVEVRFRIGEMLLNYRLVNLAGSIRKTDASEVRTCGEISSALPRLSPGFQGLVSFVTTVLNSFNPSIH